MLLNPMFLGMFEEFLIYYSYVIKDIQYGNFHSVCSATRYTTL
jgi:hypothetical protein